MTEWLKEPSHGVSDVGRGKSANHRKLQDPGAELPGAMCRVVEALRFEPLQQDDYFLRCERADGSCPDLGKQIFAKDPGLFAERARRDRSLK